jgi:hypothetical protein
MITNSLKSLKIYAREEIEKAKKSPSFEREYCLKYAGKIGNLLSQQIIDNSISLGERLKHITKCL